MIIIIALPSYMIRERGGRGEGGKQMQEERSGKRKRYEWEIGLESPHSCTCMK